VPHFVEPRYDSCESHLEDGKTVAGRMSGGQSGTTADDANALGLQTWYNMEIDLMTGSNLAMVSPLFLLGDSSSCADEV
jgi:hypothetical protein